MKLTILNTDQQPVTLSVEVAETQVDIARGLMGRESLPEYGGMLFDYGETVDNTEYYFWMSNTTIPLSIAFIDTWGVIVDIRDMQPLDLTEVYSSAPYRYALEVNQGFFGKHAITAGCKVAGR